MRSKQWIAGVAVLLAAVAAGLIIALPGGSSGAAVAGDSDPARLEPIGHTGLSRVILSPDADRRLGIRTAVIERRGSHGTVMPYAAVLYDPEGRTFVYTSPSPRVFVRHTIAVRRIVGQRALLSGGPPAGTAVVTVGSQELFGVEHEVEED